MEQEISFREYDKLIRDDLFLHPYGDHGIKHTRRVLYLAFQLAKKYSLNPKEWKLLALACCYHDIGRVNDITDYTHGRRSVNKCLKLKLPQAHNLSDEEWEIVSDLMHYHAVPDSHFTRNDQRILLLFKILKDADGLDRVRFNDLNIKYLRLPDSKGLIPMATKMVAKDTGRL